MTGPDADELEFTYNGPVLCDDDELLTAAGAVTLDRSTLTGWIETVTVGDIEETLGYDDFGAVESSEVIYDGTTSLFEYTLVRDELGRITDALGNILDWKGNRSRSAYTWCGTIHYGSNCDPFARTNESYYGHPADSIVADHELAHVLGYRDNWLGYSIMAIASRFQEMRFAWQNEGVTGLSNFEMDASRMSIGGEINDPEMAGCGCVCPPCRGKLLDGEACRWARGVGRVWRSAISRQHHHAIRRHNR